jgi:transcriptional regulator with XRE-family HTH domain
MSQPITTLSQLLHIVRARRQSLRLTQQEVAKKLSISQHHLSDLENGRRVLDVDRLLALFTLLKLEMVVQDKTQTAKAEW